MLCQIHNVELVDCYGKLVCLECEKLESYKRIRKTWEINPVTRVKDKKRYNRTEEKRKFKRMLEEE